MVQHNPEKEERAPAWWKPPRNVSIVVDNDSWILPFAQEIVTGLISQGDNAVLVRRYEDVLDNGVAFFLGCVKIAPKDALEKNHKNLVVHESDLPEGRGFSPLTWQILEGKNSIPICLLEASDEVDAGDVVLRDLMEFQGHELIDELRLAQGKKTIELCLEYLRGPIPPVGTPQSGRGSIYQRRRPDDSRINPRQSILEQFDLLRTVDNEKYPAFFEVNGERYVLAIRKETPLKP